MSKHTPGAWSFGYSGASGYCIHGGGQHIATSILYKKDGGEANARLIAAAPDLLAALLDLKQMVEEHHNGEISADTLATWLAMSFAPHEKAGAAIAKATGAA